MCAKCKSYQRHVEAPIRKKEKRIEEYSMVVVGVDEEEYQLH